MHWQLSDEQEMFAASLREWIAAKHPADTVRALHESAADETFTSALIGEGWWGVGYSEELGGQGGGVLELALAAREFGRAAMTDSRWLAAALAAPLLTDDELSAQLSGRHHFAVATSADRIPVFDPVSVESGRLSAIVPHVLGAAGADVLLVPVTGADGPALARVAASSATLSAENVLDRSRSVCTVEFSDAPVADVHAADPSAVSTTIALAAVLTAADSLGSAERMLDLAVEYSKQRKQFGQYIGAFQAVKHAAAQMLVTVEAAYSIGLYAAAAVDADLSDATVVSAAAKAQVTGSVSELADSALTVHGAIGYTWEHDLHLFYKRAKLDRTLFGSPRAWNERIAEALLN